MTIYVASPLGDRTAGPEALTQLVDAVRRRGEEASLIPMRNFRGRRNDPEYDIYDFAVAERIARPDEAILVLSEVSPIESHRELRQVPRHRTWMGWFSVNNSPDPRARYYRPSERTGSTYPPGFAPPTPPVPADLGLQVAARGPFRDIREARARMRDRGLRATAVEAVSLQYARRLVDSEIGMFGQSFYAQGFCREVLQREVPVITDPIRVVQVPTVQRARDVVLYNKAKSWSLIGEVATRVPEATFRAIDGMSYAQVVEALASATCYLELGHLPGRDRMPREAAHLGTPVVLLARGAGYVWADAPLPVQDRIAFRPGWPDAAADAVRGVLADPVAARKRQESYRDWVGGERERYEAAVDAWLEEALSR